MITKQFQLDSNFSIKMERDEEGERKIHLYDDKIDYTELLAIFDEHKMKWKYTHPKFFQFMKKHPSAFKNNIHKPMETQSEITISKQFKCFKRKIKIKIKKITHIK